MTLIHIDHGTVHRFVTAFAQMTFPLLYADGEAWVRDAGFDPGDQPWDAFGPEGSNQAGVLVIKSPANGFDITRADPSDRVMYAQLTVTDATDETTQEELNDAFAEQAALLTELLGKPTKKTRRKPPTITWMLPNGGRVRLILNTNVHCYCDTTAQLAFEKYISQ